MVGSRCQENRYVFSNDKTARAATYHREREPSKTVLTVYGGGTMERGFRMF